VSKAEGLTALIQPGPNDCSNRGVHPGGIATAGEDTDALHAIQR
jgi:hypothetical protein